MNPRNPNTDVEEGVIDESELKVECPETARCPPHSVLFVFSIQSSFEDHLDVLEADVAVNLLVQVDADSLDRNAHLVDPDVEVADDRLLDCAS